MRLLRYYIKDNFEFRDATVKGSLVWNSARQVGLDVSAGRLEMGW